MGNFNRGGRFDSGRRPSFGGGNDRGGFAPRRSEMFPATCGECGEHCEVPFKPVGNKPVLCSNCFRKDDSRPQRSFGGRDSGPRDSFRPSFGGEKRMFEATCDKCGDRCEVPFRPTGEKPVYCRECFGKGDSSGAGARGGARGGAQGGAQGGDQSKAQLEQLNAKLDKIMKALGISAAPAVVTAPTPAKAEEKKAEVVVEEKSKAKKGKKEAAAPVEAKKPEEKPVAAKKAAKKGKK